MKIFCIKNSFFIMITFLAACSLYAHADFHRETVTRSETYPTGKRIAVSNAGTAIEVYNRVFYLEGITQSDWDWVWRSFFHAGILSAVFSAVALKSGVYFLGSRQWWMYYTGLTLSGFFYADALLSRTWYALKLFQGILKLDYPGSLVAVAAWVISKDEHIPNDYIGNIFNSRLYVFMPIALTLNHFYFTEQDVNDPVIRNIGLSGNAARLFMLKSVILPQGKMAFYSLNRIALDNEPEESDSYSRLAKVMSGLEIEELTMTAPYRPTKMVNNSSVYSHFYSTSFVEVFGYGYEQNKETSSFRGILTLDNSEKDELHLLLDNLMLDQDQLSIHSVRSILSPDIIGEIADWIKDNEEGIKEEKNSSRDYLMPALRLGKKPGISMEVSYLDEGVTLIALPDSEEKIAATITLNSKDKTVSLMTDCEEAKCIQKQYISPAWLNKIFLLQLSYMGYRYGHMLAKAGMRTILPAERAIPLYSVTDYTGEDNDCPVCKGELPVSEQNQITVSEQDQVQSGGSIDTKSLSLSDNSVDLFQNADEDNNVISSLHNLPCNHPICPSCLDDMIQNKISDNQDSAWQFINFFISCPTCRNEAHFLILP